MLDLYSFRSEVRTKLLQRWQCLDLETEALDWSWSLWAMRQGQVSQNQLFVNALDQCTRWITTDSAWSLEKNWGAIGLICRLLRQEGDATWEHVAENLIEKLRQLNLQGFSKFSWTNNPHAVYGVVVGVESRLDDETQEWLRQHCLRHSQSGNWHRRLLFLAAFLDLGGVSEPLDLAVAELGLHELPCVLWFCETYPHLFTQELQLNLWNLLADWREQILLDPLSGGLPDTTCYVSSDIDVAMLCSAVVSRTQETNPLALFYAIPFHPDVRQAAESLFLNGEYVNAVLEAAKAFINAVKDRAGHPADAQGRPLDGRALVQQVFSAKNPLLKFNSLSTQSERDEQEGLKLIAEGIVAAIRNPKGHEPKERVAILPQEALDQLVIVSYIYKRVDSAQC